LVSADNRGVKITIVYGKKELETQEQIKLGKLTHLSIRFYQYLHAKCYINEERAVITSMNMHKYSEKKNREIGILIDKNIESDSQAYEAALNEINSIIEISVQAQQAKHYTDRSSVLEADNNSLKYINQATTKSPVNRSDDTSRAQHTKVIIQGHCIRCGKNIPYDPSHPYCHTCFNSWIRYENPDYIEKYCHRCGGNDRSSMLYPLCHNCFQKSQSW
jgi:hypothetical protein